MALSASFCFAGENIIRLSAPVNFIAPAPAPEAWLEHDPLISEWVASGDLYGCASKNPLASTISSRLSYQQTYSGCTQDESRSVQPQVIGEVSHEIKPAGPSTTEYRSSGNLSGQRMVMGTYAQETIDYAFSGAATSGLGAGYYRQNGGGYNFGTSMQKTANGHTMLAAVIYYSGSYSLQVLGTTGAGLNAVDATKFDTSQIQPYLAPYRGVRFIKNDGTILVEHLLPKTSDTRNYYGKTATISASEYAVIYNNIGHISSIRLFE